jgi:hypothetical protein
LDAVEPRLHGSHSTKQFLRRPFALDSLLAFCGC